MMLYLVSGQQWPEGSHKGAPYPHRKEKETPELTFSWSPWLAGLLTGAYPCKQ